MTSRNTVEEQETSCDAPLTLVKDSGNVAHDKSFYKTHSCLRHERGGQTFRLKTKDNLEMLAWR